MKVRDVKEREGKGKANKSPPGTLLAAGEFAFT